MNPGQTGQRQMQVLVVIIVGALVAAAVSQAAWTVATGKSVIAEMSGYFGEAVGFVLLCCALSVLRALRARSG